MGVGPSCGQQWPWLGAVAGTKTGERFTVFHRCVMPSGHLGDHECQCSFNQQNPSMRYTNAHRRSEEPKSEGPD